MRAGLAHAWSKRYGQAAQPPADRSRQRWCRVALACPRLALGCQATSGWSRRTAPCCLSAVGFRPALPTPDKHLSAHPAFQPTMFVASVPFPWRRCSLDFSMMQPSVARCCCPWNGWFLDPFALCWFFSSALGGRHATDYYGSAAPVVALATCPPTPCGGASAGSGVARRVISPSAVGPLPISLSLTSQVGKYVSRMNSR
jgi:hypothetical protein